MATTINFNLKPIEFNPVVDQASDTTYILEVHDAADTVVSMTGYTAKMQIRPYHGSSTVYDTLTTENGRLVADENGITVKFPASATKNYTFSQAVYDVLIYYGTSQWRIAQGVIRFDEEVTI